MQDIILVGFGGHAKSVVDSIENGKKYNIIGYTDVKPCEEYHGYPYLGTDECLKEYYEKGVRQAFITVGFMGKSRLRDKLYDVMKEIGYDFPAIIDATAVLANDVCIGEGTYIGKNVVVNSDAHIGKMCIINTSSIIEHECRVGDYTHVAGNAMICGNVSISDHCMIGASATIIQGITVCENVIVGAGAVVVNDIVCGEIVVGVPAKSKAGK